jgi:hypothetical protein
MQQQHEQELHAYESEERQKDRDLTQYTIDENNRTKIETAEISAYGFVQAPVEDIAATADMALKTQDLSQKHFLEQQKLAHDKTKHDKEVTRKEKELRSKQELENKKIEAIRVQNKSQEAMQNKQIKLKEKEMANKLQIERLKIKAKPKPSKK